VNVSPTNKEDRNAAPVRLFATQADWTAWLKENYSKSNGLWLRLAKKRSGLKSVSYAEALEVALCYGWIDGQKQSDTDKTWLQKFVPRSDNSVWSKINREKALALIKNGKMKPPGRHAIERAKKSGRWESAYDSPSRALVPPDLQAALDTNPKAKQFFAQLDGANRYAILFRVQTVKRAETRARKIRLFVEMLEKKETLHPPRKARSSNRRIKWN
jgi:uncharacterized protein YdeI (YjbR/CyaY-like superfamily)